MRVVMFVDTDLVADSRVRREAVSLGAAGHEVTVVSRQTDAARGLERVTLDGFANIRVPYPEASAGQAVPPFLRLIAAIILRATGVATALRTAAFATLRGPLEAWGRSRHADLGRQPLSVGRIAAAAAAILPRSVRSRAQERIGFRRHVSRFRAVIARRPALAIATKPPSATAVPHPMQARRPAATPGRAETDARRAPKVRDRGRRPQPPAGAGPPTIYNSTVMWLAHWRYARTRWAHAAAAAAPRADVWHGHDLSGLPAAIAARGRHGGIVVYDSHELFLDSNIHADRPRWARRLMAWFERRWARSAAAVVTVNNEIARELASRYGVRDVVVVHNCPPRWQPTAGAADRLRAAAGVPAGASIAVYHGRFARHRGLEQLAAAVAQPGLEDVHAVFLGFGGVPRSIREPRDPRMAERLHVVPPVLAEQLLDFISTADVGVMAIQPSTLNHWLSTPNKLFETIGAGVPVVVSNFPAMSAIVTEWRVGETCDPTSPGDIARAIAAILSLSEAERGELRARCLRAAHERWNWETESQGLIDLYAELERTGRAPARSSSSAA